jgi:hypothetical protein
MRKRKTKMMLSSIETPERCALNAAQFSGVNAARLCANARGVW